jgi:hypothetical protein
MFVGYYVVYLMPFLIVHHAGKNLISMAGQNHDLQHLFSESMQ